jgi:hypothetical protein
MVRAEHTSFRGVEVDLVQMAEALYRRALEENARLLGSANTRANLGFPFVQMKYIDGAERELRAAIECSPLHIDAHQDLGTPRSEGRGPGFPVSASCQGLCS